MQQSSSYAVWEEEIEILYHDPIHDRPQCYYCPRMAKMFTSKNKGYLFA